MVDKKWIRTIKKEIILKKSQIKNTDKHYILKIIF